MRNIRRPKIYDLGDTFMSKRFVVILKKNVNLVSSMTDSDFCPQLFHEQIELHFQNSIKLFICYLFLDLERLFICCKRSV